MLKKRLKLKTVSILGLNKECTDDPVNDDDYFDERIAATYDDDAEMFDPKVVDSIVGMSWAQRLKRIFPLCQCK